MNNTTYRLNEQDLFDHTYFSPGVHGFNFINTSTNPGFV